MTENRPCQSLPAFRLAFAGMLVLGLVGWFANFGVVLMEQHSTSQDLHSANLRYFAQQPTTSTPTTASDELYGNFGGRSESSETYGSTSGDLSTESSAAQDQSDTQTNASTSASADAYSAQSKPNDAVSNQSHTDSSRDQVQEPIQSESAVNRAASSAQENESYAAESRVPRDNSTVEQDSTISRTERGTELPTTTSLASTQQKAYAYMFYITSDNYACAALQLMHRLVHKVHMDTTTIDLVVLHTPRVGTRLLDKMQQQLNARTVQVDELRAVSSDPTWLTSLTKLRAFQDWGYERVVFLDADAFPMANLDHLFKLPSAPLIAPTAYWIQQPFFASTLMVIEPSNTTFDSILQWAKARGAAAGFDMDILNAFFKDSVQYLPGEYNVLNSDFRSAPESENKLFPTTSELKSHTKVVHFSCKPDGAYGKPWGWPSHDLSLLDGKGFDTLFRELFEDYWRGEKELCEQ